VGAAAQLSCETNLYKESMRASKSKCPVPLSALTIIDARRSGLSDVWRSGLMMTLVMVVTLLDSDGCDGARTRDGITRIM